MQEKQQHFNKKFTDRAWGEMSRLLEAEMPVAARPKRRVIGWWWLLVGLGIGLGASTAIAWYFGKQKAKEAAVQYPVAAVQPTAKEPANHSGAASDAAISPAVVQQEEKTPAPANKSSVPSKGGRTDSPVSSGKQVSPGAFAENSAVAPAQPKMENVIETATPSMATPAIIKNAASQVAENLDLLNTLALEPLEMTTPSAPDFKTVSFKTGKKSPGFAVYGSAMTTPFAKGDGLAGGILMDVKLNSRFSFETGLGYSFIRQPLSILVAEKDVTIGSPNVDLDSSEITYTFEDLKTQADNLEKNYLLASQDLALHYLEMPLSLHYRANARWSFHTSLHLSLLLASAPDFTRGGVFTKNNGRFQAAEVQSGSGMQASSFSVPVTSFDAAAVAGVRYHLTPGLSMGLQYQMGLTDVIQSNKASDFNRLFRLSLVYRLK